MRTILTLIISFLSLSDCFSQQLKSIVYDFDGQDLGETDLPDGDYNNFDLVYEVAANPLAPSDVLGDRVLRTDLNWSMGKGEFGKGMSRYIELDVTSDRFCFYIYNPLSNHSSAVAEVVIKEDDNQNRVYESTLDDRWSRSITIARSGAWQLISLPLNTFTDSNTGGNGIFDAAYTGDAGQVLIVGITFNRATLPAAPETYYLDMICFTDGAMPVGSSILQPPYADPGDKCLLGVLAYSAPADSVPAEVEALFTSGKKLDYVNIFMPYAYSGTVASALPGPSIQGLINQGYRPIITWESMYTAYAPLDPIQPRLNDIISGSFDSYIDDFADRIKTYSDTVILRLFHEFDGDWYPWSTFENGQDPNRLVNAFRYIVDRFNARGTTNVLWAWSPNASPTPNRFYNWSVFAYPGDAYVDIVGTSVYNHPTPGTPPWRSFRSSITETYYYLSTYFPSKPFFIYETASRERYAGEMSSSQTKAGWICQSSQDLQSYFHKTRAIVFFSTIKSHDWRINSSANALEAINDCFWVDPYFSETITGLSNAQGAEGFSVYPNPFRDELLIRVEDQGVTQCRLEVFDVSGKKLESREFSGSMLFGAELSAGLYILELRNGNKIMRCKVLKN